MLKRVGLGLLVLALAGCASPNSLAPEIASHPGAKFRADERGYQYLDRLLFSYALATEPVGDTLPACVAKYVDNRGVTVSETRGYVGPHTGNYYSSTSSSNIAGGEVLKYIAEDRRSVAAEGSEKYSVSSGMVPIDRSVRFSLDAAVQQQTLSLVFSKLEQVQIQAAGGMAGYYPVGAWSGADSDKAAASLERVADNINSCLSKGQS